VARPNAVINPQTKKMSNPALRRFLKNGAKFLRHVQGRIRPERYMTFLERIQGMRSAGQGPFPKSSRLTRRHQNGSSSHRKRLPGFC